MGIGIFGGGNSSTKNETKNYIDSSVHTDQSNQSRGAQSGDNGISALNSDIDTSNRSTNTNTYLDGGAIQQAAKVTMSVVEAGAARDRQTVEAMGSLSARAMDGAFSALKSLGDRVMGSADATTKSAYSIAGQGMVLAGDAKAPDAAITKTTIYAMAGIAGAVVLFMVINGRGKR